MRTPDSAPSRFASAVSAVVRFAAKLREAGDRRRAIRSLTILDDHMLRDIGLTRFDVEAALVEPALTDGTLILAERARETRQRQRSAAREAQAWTSAGLDAVRRRAA